MISNLTNPKILTLLKVQYSNMLEYMIKNMATITFYVKHGQTITLMNPH